VVCVLATYPDPARDRPQEPSRCPVLAQFMLILDLSWVNVALPSLSADHD